MRKATVGISQEIFLKTWRILGKPGELAGMLTSEEQAQKFYTSDSVCHSPHMGNASDWLKQISPSAQPIRSITQNWVVTSHQHGKFYSHSSDMASAAGLCSPFSNSHTPFCSPEQDSDA